jgi:hypothetical protein
MPRPQRVFKPGNVTLDATGYGAVAVTAPSGVVWNVYLVSVSTTQTDTTVKPPRFNLYADASPNRAHFIEGSGSGNQDSSDSPHVIYGGESLCGEWVAGTPGSIATITVRAMQMEL